MRSVLPSSGVAVARVIDAMRIKNRLSGPQFQQPKSFKVWKSLKLGQAPQLQIRKRIDCSESKLGHLLLNNCLAIRLGVGLVKQDARYKKIFSSGLSLCDLSFIFLNIVRCCFLVAS